MSIGTHDEYASVPGKNLVNSILDGTGKIKKKLSSIDIEWKFFFFAICLILAQNGPFYLIL